MVDQPSGPTVRVIPRPNPARRMRSWGLRALIVLLVVALPLAELWALIAVGRQLGALATIGLVVATSVLGLILLIREGSKAWRALITAMRDGRVPSRELVDGSLVVLGGVGFLVPGFLTDLMGLILLIPPTRALVRRLIGATLAKQVANGRERSGVIPGQVAPDDDPPASDGDVVVGRLLP